MVASVLSPARNSFSKVVLIIAYNAFQGWKITPIKHLEQTINDSGNHLLEYYERFPYNSLLNTGESATAGDETIVS